MIEKAPARSRALLLLGGLAVAALAVLAWGLAQRTDPHDLVVAYTDAIAEGDVEAADALATDGVDGEGPLPEPGSTDDVEPVTDVQVGRDGEPTGVGTVSGERYDALGYDVS
ncbi:hypothetical protein [Klenkia taihuensis]|uniref:Uncharacterized protein n=1 Tax=Klenkia taihuensis TaxID=1225127 RepID=A0A1I1P0U2_9ACTN|nr:hypothetical protein [Klenkia taihuensis]SFD03276.1 hypothetical protein SAMN05661030_2357 [Klenkia taihuensis]